VSWGCPASRRRLASPDGPRAVAVKGMPPKGRQMHYRATERPHLGYVSEPDSDMRVRF